VSLLRRALVPVADEDDAVATARALRPHAGRIETVVAVHVIEKGGGAIDKAPLEKRQGDAEDCLAVAETELGDAVAVETRIAYGTDVVEAISDTADEVDATAIAFRARGGSRIVRLLSGDTTARLATHPTVPTVSLPDPDDA
jgi:nucleotide-binding universal stress UspA family protein